MSSFNALTPAEAERLAMLAEECGEVCHAIGKVLRHGFDSKHPDRVEQTGDNRCELFHEVADFIAVVRAMADAGDFKGSATFAALDNHFEQRLRWRRKLRYSHHQG